MKRFQFVNGRWIKSQKIVKFPREGFDPGAFLVPLDSKQTEQQAAQVGLKKSDLRNTQELDTGDCLGVQSGVNVGNLNLKGT